MKRATHPRMRYRQRGASLLLMVIMIFYPDGLGRTILDRLAALRAPSRRPTPAPEREG